MEPPPNQPEIRAHNEDSGGPVIHKVTITPSVERNGWLVVPTTFSMSAEVTGADSVMFHNWRFDSQPFGPEHNGGIEIGSTTDGRLWTAEAMNQSVPARSGVYVAAKNDHGQTVSPVIFVIWDYHAQSQ